MSLLPLLKTGGEEEASLLPSRFGIGASLLPSRKREGEEGLRFRKSPELAAYSAADSPEKVKSPKTKTRKVRVPAPQPISQKPVFSTF